MYYARLNHTFLGNWIDCRAAKECPAISPNLSPSDIFLCGYLKSMIYKTATVVLQDLENHI